MAALKVAGTLRWSDKFRAGNIGTRESAKGRRRRRAVRVARGWVLGCSVAPHREWVPQLASWFSKPSQFLAGHVAVLGIGGARTASFFDRSVTLRVSAPRPATAMTGTSRRPRERRVTATVPAIPKHRGWRPACERPLAGAHPRNLRNHLFQNKKD
jgi:hypothetical protein